MFEQRVKEVFVAVFQCDPVSLSEASSPAEIDGWDSFGHLALVEALQSEFKISFEVEDIAAMDSLGQIQRIVALRANSERAA
jgi:acyl carrier protein